MIAITYIVVFWLAPATKKNRIMWIITCIWQVVWERKLYLKLRFSNIAWLKQKHTFQIWKSFLSYNKGALSWVKEELTLLLVLCYCCLCCGVNGVYCSFEENFIQKFLRSGNILIMLGLVLQVCCFQFIMMLI